MSSKSSLIVSARGQITLPSDIRKRFGINEGGVVTVEERHGEIVLRPATVLELEMYADQDIQKWDKEDEISSVEKNRIKKKLGRKG